MGVLQELIHGLQTVILFNWSQWLRSRTRLWRWRKHCSCDQRPFGNLQLYPHVCHQIPGKTQQASLSFNFALFLFYFMFFSLIVFCFSFPQPLFPIFLALSLSLNVVTSARTDNIHSILNVCFSMYYCEKLMCHIHSKFELFYKGCAKSSGSRVCKFVYFCLL